MRYKQYTVTPFWTSQTKMELLYDLQDKDEEIESLKEQLKSEREYSQSVLKCSEELQNQRNVFKRRSDNYYKILFEEQLLYYDSKIRFSSWLEKSFKDLLKSWA